MEPAIASLDDKIMQLISMCEKLEKENSLLREQASNHGRQIADKDLKIRKLTEKLDNLQLIEAFKGSTDGNVEAARRVAEVIREIDKCIAMLSD